MSAIVLTVQPLSRAAFAPFGQVIETDGAAHFPINQGTTERFHDLAGVDVRDGDGHPLINIFRGRPFAPPIAIRLVERHPLGSQAFVPLNGRPYLVVVAPTQPDATPAAPKAFLARGDQGVNYAKGTWHHPLLPLQRESDFLVIDRGGPSENLEEHRYPGPGFVIERIPSN